MAPSRNEDSFFKKNKLALVAGSLSLFESVADNCGVFTAKHSTALKIKHGIVTPLIYAGFYTLLGHMADKTFGDGERAAQDFMSKIRKS